MHSSRSLIRLTIALLGVGLVFLIGIVGMTIWLGERSQTYFNEVVEARDARRAAVELRNAVRTAESSQRGFVITGDEVYLEPYGAARVTADQELVALKAVLAPYPEAAAPVQRLDQVIAEKFAEMDTTIALKRAGQDDELMTIVRTDRGKALMDEANAFFDGLVRAADDRLTVGVAEQRRNAVWLRISTIAGGLVIVTVVGFAALTVLRYTRELAAARDQVEALNSGLEERVRDRTADLARANDEIQRFAYIVTHDLRAPLVNIMGFTSELEASVESLRPLIERAGADTDDDPVAREARIAATEDLPEAIGFIRSSTRKMDALINAILRLSREGGRSLRPEPVDLTTLIATSADSIQHQVSEADGAITLDLNAPPIVSDRLALEHIFGNLLDNAVKYRSKDRPLRITITARVVAGNRVGVDIADNGRGIAEQDLGRVFELFRRSGTQDQPGEGIGLAYVRTVVRNLGGEIDVSSTLGAGTTFRVVLPRTLKSNGVKRDE